MDQKVCETLPSECQGEKKAPGCIIPPEYWTGPLYQKGLLKHSVQDFCLFADDARHRKSETNHSDDSDSTAILMAYDAKANTYSEQREREKSMYGQRNSRSQDAYYDRVYMQEKEREKERDRDYRGKHGD